MARPSIFRFSTQFNQKLLSEHSAIVLSNADSLSLQKKVTKVKCALFIATQNGELEDECKDIWHVQTEDENSGQSSGRMAGAMNSVTV